MKRLTIASALVVASACWASPLGKVLASNIPGHPTHGVLGFDWQAGDADAFDSIRFSPDRNRWAISGELENGTTDLDVIVRGTRVPWAITDIVAKEGDLTGFLSDTWVSIRDSMNIGNDGTVYFAGDTDNVSSADDVVMSWNGSPTLLAREGDPVPDNPTLNFGSGNNSIHATNDGRIRWVSTGLTGSGTATGQTQMVFQLQAGAGTVLARNGITIPTGQIVAPDQTISAFTTDRLQSAAETGDYFFNVTLNGPTSSNVAMILNNQVVVQETALLSGFATGVASLSSGNAHTITANGQFTLSRGAVLTGNEDFCLLNGQVIAATDAPVSPGSPWNWDDAVYGPTFVYSTCNGFGEYAIGGLINNPDTTRDAIVVFTAAGKTTEVLAEGDPIDLDGNGVADDGAFISIFEDNKMTVTDGNIAYLTVEAVDAVGAFLGDCLIEVYLPLTGDVDDSAEVDAADIDRVIAEFGSTTPGIPEDVDGSGEVDAADIDIVIANFGRTR